MLTDEEFAQWAGALRPRLHRYCARMAGSVVDGEDVVQETLAKAYQVLTVAHEIENAEAWSFRVAHNKAMDFLRRRAREQDLVDAGEFESEAAEDRLSRNEIASLALTAYMRLTARERSCTILKDVLGYSLREISELVDASELSVKAALHRGRQHLRSVQSDPAAENGVQIDAKQRQQLDDYISKFNNREFDLLRDTLAADVRLDLVGRHQAKGKAGVGNYFSNYEKIDNWHMAPGLIDDRVVAVVFVADEVKSAPAYFVLLEWTTAGLLLIRDFRYARYVMESARVIPLN